MNGSRKTRTSSQLYPDVFPPDNAGWRARRSAQTRIALLEACIASLNELGYARTTTATIADFAGISRGAMIHHYATKLELIAAVIDYALYQQLERYKEKLSELSVETLKDTVLLTNLYFETAKSREYQTYLELLMASRSDEELAALLVPKAKIFRTAWHREMLRILPGWQDKKEELALCTDVAMLLNEALLLNTRILDDPAERARILDLFATTTLMVRGGKIQISRKKPMSMKKGISLPRAPDRSVTSEKRNGKRKAAD